MLAHVHKENIICPESLKCVLDIIEDHDSKRLGKKAKIREFIQKSSLYVLIVYTVIFSLHSHILGFLWSFFFNIVAKYT